MNDLVPRWLISAWILALATPCLADSDARPTAEPSEPLSVSQVVERVRPSLATIRVSNRDGKQHGLGTGFVIADELIATNLHVIGEGRRFTVEMSDGRKLQVVAIEASDHAQDLAVLRVAPLGEPLIPLRLGESALLQQGVPVVAMGNPWGLKESVVSGVISAFRQIDGREMIQLAMPIEPGNSGGPVVDLQGRVLGVVNMKSTVQKNVAFALRVDALKTILEAPNPVSFPRWVARGTMDSTAWSPLFGAQWKQRADRIQVSGLGRGFGGRSLCLSKLAPPDGPFEVGVSVRLDDESGAAGLVFHSDGGDKHYGFYPTSGNLRLTCFAGPSVYSWQVLSEISSPHYRRGDWNHLKVRVEANKLLCYLNDQLVIESGDTTFTKGGIGLAKFRQTQAEFKQFQVADRLPPSQASPGELERARALVDDLADFGALTNTDLDSLGGDLAPASLTLLNNRARELDQQAKQLELQAKQLRRIADDVHVQQVAKELSEQFEGSEPVDLLQGALLIAKLEDKEIDIPAYVSAVDRMAEQIRSRLPENADDTKRQQALSKFLFAESGYHGSRFEYYHRANSFMNRVIDDREGLPITLSVLYMELGERLGLKIVGVGLPGHFVVRLEPTEGEEQLIDPFHGGKLLSRADAVQIVRDYANRDLNERDLQPSPPRDTLTRMLNNLLNQAQREQDREGMLRFLEGLVALSPESINFRGLRAVVRSETGRKAAAISDLDWILQQPLAPADMARIRDMRKYFERSR